MDHLQSATTKEYEIDFHVLKKTLLKYKLAIIAFTAFTTISATVYTWLAPTIFSGSVLIEIGDVIINGSTQDNKPITIMPLDNVNNLKAVFNQTLKDNKNNISVKIPQGSSNLLLINYEDRDKQIIKNKLEEITDITLKRDKEKTLFLQQADAIVKPTAIISNITISPNPIKPKKQLIIGLGFLSGLIFGIFIAFFLELISTKLQED